MLKQITISIMALGLLSLPAFAQSSGFDINVPLPTGGYAPLPTGGYPAPPTSGYAPLPISGYPALPTSGYAPLPTGSWANVITPVVQTAVQAVTQGQAANYMSIPVNTTGQGIGLPTGLPATSTSGVAINTVSCPNCRDSGYVDPTFTGAASPTGAISSLGTAFPGGNLTNGLINAGASSLINSVLPSNSAPLTFNSLNTMVPPAAPAPVAQPPSGVQSADMMMQMTNSGN